MEQFTDFSWANDPTVRLSYFGGEGRERPVVIVLPGGGYAVCAPNEGAPVAEHFAGMGYAAFVLYYSTSCPGLRPDAGGPKNPHTLFPEPLRELAAAVAYIRQNAERFHADGNRLATLGFSAGGHLAANYANLWCSEEIYGGIADPGLLRPDINILGYGATELTANSMMLPAVFGEQTELPKALLRCYSARYGIGTQTPPTFLFHSVTDPVVPVQQSIDMARALEDADVVYELHLFGCGNHAYGLGSKKTNPGQWPELADRFLRHCLERPADYDKAQVAKHPFG